MASLDNSSARLRRAIIVADDFGVSPSVNQAVIEAHRKGALTCASLMVGGAAWEDAVERAKAHPDLGVGLHGTLACGFSVAGHEAAPNLANERGELGASPVAVGWNCFSGRIPRAELEAEIRAQFDRFRRTGLRLDHINGHLNMHLHPVALPIILECAAETDCRWIRLTRDPLDLNQQLAVGRAWYRWSHSLIFESLSAYAEGRLKRAGFCHADRVFGLLQSGDMNPSFVRSLLRQLPTGLSEIYFHPDYEGGEANADLRALMSPDVMGEFESRGIARARFQDV